MHIGWDVRHRATDALDDFVPLSPEQAALPGYVEHIERGYEDSPWQLERVLLLGPDRGDQSGL